MSDIEGAKICPNCGDYCDRDEVDVGVGVICGPWGCACGWSEDPEYNQIGGSGGWRGDGAYLDPYGGVWPAENPVVKMMKSAGEDEGAQE